MVTLESVWEMKPLRDILGVQGLFASGEESDTATNEDQAPVESPVGSNPWDGPCGSKMAGLLAHRAMGVAVPSPENECSDEFLNECTRRGMTYRSVMPNCTGDIPPSCTREAQIAAWKREQDRLKSEADQASADAVAAASAQAQYNQEAAPVTPEELGQKPQFSAPSVGAKTFGPSAQRRIAPPPSYAAELEPTGGAGSMELKESSSAGSWFMGLLIGAGVLFAGYKLFVKKGRK